MRVSADEIIHSIKSNSDFCIYTHVKPDGDAVGSAFALAIALQKLGKKVCVKCQDPWPNAFNKLIDMFTPDLVDNETGIAVDVSTASRLGIYKNANISLCIDHHKSNLCCFPLTYLEEDAISCSSIIFRLIESLFTIVPKEARQLLFVGMLTDSDGFRSSEVTRKVFLDAYDILSDDLNPAEIIKNYYSNKTSVDLICEKIILDNLKYYHDSKVAVSMLPKYMYDKVKTTSTDLLASIPAKIVGVELGVTIFEKDDMNFAVSIRSNGIWDASLLAGCIGGGGHKSAAGATVFGKKYNELLCDICMKIKDLYL